MPEPSLAPASDKGALSKFAHRDRGQEDLMSGHEADLRLETGSAPAAERGAKDASVDDDPHESSAAANASSSSSDSSSIRSVSTEVRAGAAASCLSVRSLGKREVPKGDSRWLSALLMTIILRQHTLRQPSPGLTARPVRGLEPAVEGVYPRQGAVPLWDGSPSSGLPPGSIYSRAGART